MTQTRQAFQENHKKATETVDKKFKLSRPHSLAHPYRLSGHYCKITKTRQFQKPPSFRRETVDCAGVKLDFDVISIRQSFCPDLKKFGILLVRKIVSKC